MKPQKHGSFHQKHSLGQNFIEDEALLSQLAELSLVTAEDCVLEIGPGFGALTKPLAERAKQVVSLEIDRTLIPILNVTLEKYANARVICDDVMRTNLSALVAEAFGADCPSLRVAANLPYYITTDVLTKLMRELPQAKSIAVMIQKEGAQRICAQAGTAQYGAFTLLCQYYADCELLYDVPPSCFLPAPKVTSSVIRMTVRGKPPVEVPDETLFFQVVRAAFAQRRKTLVNTLSTLLGKDVDKSTIKALICACNLTETVRGERLSFADFAELTQKIVKLRQK